MSLVGVLAATAVGHATSPVTATSLVKSSYERQWSVTLITGDRVLVRRDGAGRYTAVVDGDRSHDGVRIMESADHLYVVPLAVQPLLHSVLDPALFDVRALVEQELDDAHVRSVPVVISQKGAEGRGRLEASTGGALDAQRVLPRAGFVTAKVAKRRAERFGARLAARAARGTEASATGVGLAGVARVWLDAQVELAWDRNLEQLRAPEAWATGFDGAGVKIGVLDTGIDATHPDFAGKVVASADFSGTGTVADGHGHGTHVAGLAAGSGAGNAGERRGVASGASLLVGKVFDDSGSTSSLSNVLAGMEWSVAQGADVVNMSLGISSWNDGTDPLSQAVNRLTALGSLFVVASGNSGPGATTVGAPGVADAALSVAAVDGADQVAEFSSRGPRGVDGALKPDVAAPGVGIISALAQGTSMGTPVGTSYTRESGTSMASPQVAGAAAVLLQRHPEWTPVQVKAALAGTADPTAAAGPADQGAGRIDVAEALAATVLPEDEDADLGFLRYPQTEVASTTASWRNDGAAPVTLDLSLDVRGPTGDRLPAEQAWLSAPSVTVPAGGSADVAVNVDPRLTAPGQHAGYLTAAIRGEDEQLQTPVGFHDEREMVDLTVRVIDRAGEPANEFFTAFNVDDMSRFYLLGERLGVDGTARLRVPPGHYYVESTVVERRIVDQRAREYDSTTELIIPELAVFADTTATLDARDAVKARSRIEGIATAAVRNTVGEFRSDSGGSNYLRSSLFLDGEDRPLYVQRDLPEVTVGEFEHTVSWHHVERPVQLSTGGRRGGQPRVLPASDAPLPDDSAGLVAVDVGTGTPDEFAAQQLSGRLAVVRRGLPLSDLAGRARAAGAALLAVTNDRPDLFDASTSPEREMPTVIVDGDDAGALRAAAASGARIGVDSTEHSAFSYDLHEQQADIGQSYTRADQRRLARIDARYPVERPDQILPYRQLGGYLLFGTPPGRTRRTEYVTPGVAVTTGAEWRYPRPDHSYFVADRGLVPHAGQRLTSTMFGAPLGSGIYAPDGVGITRTGDLLDVAMADIADGDGHSGDSISWDGGPGVIDTMRVYRNGRLGAELDQDYARFLLPPERSRYRIEAEQDGSAVTPLGTRTFDVWEFDSASTEDEESEVLPLPEIDYDLEVDDRNRLTSRRIAVNVVPQPGLEAIAVRSLQVRYSTDDGVSWHEPRHTSRLSNGSLTAKLPRLSAGKVLSLRAEATTAADVSHTDTTIRALEVGGSRRDDD